MIKPALSQSAVVISIPTMLPTSVYLYFRSTAPGTLLPLFVSLVVCHSEHHTSPTGSERYPQQLEYPQQIQIDSTKWYRELE
jgi:hypothetical protein